MKGEEKAVCIFFLQIKSANYLSVASCYLISSICIRPICSGPGPFSIFIKLAPVISFHGVICGGTAFKLVTHTLTNIDNMLIIAEFFYSSLYQQEVCTTLSYSEAGRKIRVTVDEE